MTTDEWFKEQALEACSGAAYVTRCARVALVAWAARKVTVTAEGDGIHDGAGLRIWLSGKRFHQVIGTKNASRIIDEAQELANHDDGDSGLFWFSIELRTKLLNDWGPSAELIDAIVETVGIRGRLTLRFIPDLSSQPTAS